MSTFLDDLAGVRDLQLNDGPLVPRRAVLHIVGSGIILTDDPVAEETVLAIPQVGLPQQAAAATLSADAHDYDAGLATTAERQYVNLIRLTASAPVALTGLQADFSPRVVLINAGSSTITLGHDNPGSTAANRFLCALSAAYALQGGRAVELVRDSISQRWRTVL